MFWRQFFNDLHIRKEKKCWNLLVLIKINPWEIKVPEVEETHIYRCNLCISENNTSNMHLCSHESNHLDIYYKQSSAVMTITFELIYDSNKWCVNFYPVLVRLKSTVGSQGCNYELFKVSANNICKYLLYTQVLVFQFACPRRSPVRFWVIL